MNRIIKFRAWDKEKNIMLPNKDDGRDVLYLLSTSGQSDSLEFMQFTGITDKNNKKIYENDILGGKYFESKIVVFDDVEVSTDPGSGYVYVLGWGVKDRFGDVQRIDEDMEVIGNIYESPELLEK